MTPSLCIFRTAASLRNWLATALLAVILLGVPGISGAENAPTSEVVQPGSLVTYDDLLEQVAEEVPGFGGMFFNDTGALSVYMAGSGLSAQAVQLDDLEQALRSNFGEDILLTPSSQQGSLTTQSVEADLTILSGQFDIPTLRDVRDYADSLLSLPGVVSTDLDEARNRVVIGVMNEAAEQKVEAELKRLGVERGAVIVERDEAVQPAEGLRDKIRPARGGIRIINELVGGVCTLGFNAVRLGVAGFVTNSHCTNTRGGVELTVFHQTNQEPDDKIAVETVDPIYWTGGWCPTGKRCRWSDSAFAVYNTNAPSLLASIARPDSWGMGSITINASQPTLPIVSETHYPPIGSYLNKIGQTTGWTYGKVTETCKHTTVGHLDGTPTDIHLLCQTFVTRDADETFDMAKSADSGSPVFKWNGVSTSLAGILWGRNPDDSKENYFVFSPLPNILAEIGYLTEYTKPVVKWTPL